MKNTEAKAKYIKNWDINYNRNIDGLPNCNNLLIICSLFYEELFNETISNSGINVRENPNLLEDLINIIINNL